MPVATFVDLIYSLAVWLATYFAHRVDAASNVDYKGIERQLPSGAVPFLVPSSRSGARKTNQDSALVATVGYP